MKVGNVFWAVVCGVVCSVGAETIDVAAGKTLKVEPGRSFGAGALVKTGEGTLDLTGVTLPGEGLEIRSGAVAISVDGAKRVKARYVRWNVTKARPGKPGAPEWANTGSQFSEFRLFREGQMLPRPKNATALNGDPNHAEGPHKGIDGKLETKCYFNPFIADFGEEVEFDAYSYATANDAIARDPFSWVLEIGVKEGADIVWTSVASIDGYEAPKARNADIGTTFPVALRDVIPPRYPLKICGKGRLVLKGAYETLEAVEGEGLIQLEDNASVTIGPRARFTGSVAGGGNVVYAGN